ncbi:MAG: hypothetical protein QOE91_1586 [Gaiellaceae bacterium]|nr:hypothetical protein [Gaiellaceae bacterium]
MLAEPRALDRPQPVSVPAAVVAAAGGFLVGVATFLLIKVVRRPRAGRALASRRRKSKRGESVEVAATRSFLVDIHLLKDR